MIEIPDEMYDWYDNGFPDENDAERLWQTIKNGTPLPKHGRLIDISQIDKDKIESDNPVISLMIDGEYIEAVSLDYLDSLPTIIEADKVESERNKYEKAT